MLTLFYSETKITLFYLLSFTFIRFHLLYHSLPFVVILYHSLYHSLSLVVIWSHALSFAVTRCHSLSLVVIRCATRSHSLSLVVTRCTTRCHSMYHSCFYKRSLYVVAYRKKLSIVLITQQKEGNRFNSLHLLWGTN